MNGFSRKALATLLVPVCLMCAGCDESVAEDTGTQSEAGTEKSTAPVTTTAALGKVTALGNAR